jgi:ribosomal protein S18 acetylase RimI-like enzyme
MTELRLNTATAEAIAAHLLRCDQDFVPPLSTRVDIEAYADKIARRAARFEAWSDGGLVGLVAAYCNDLTSRSVFVTSVSVDQAFQGRGVAAALMDMCIEHARRQGFARVALEVDSTNTAAMRLYEQKGFSIAGISGRTFAMVVDIPEGTSG